MHTKHLGAALHLNVFFSNTSLVNRLAVDSLADID
jgi:hypothetical protein